MGDLLLRGIDDALKRQLQESAIRNGRSLSDEAIEQLRRSLGRKAEDHKPAGARLRLILGEESFSDDELGAIADFRRQPDRDPPRFD